MSLGPFRPCSVFSEGRIRQVIKFMNEHPPPIPPLSADTARALGLLDDYCTKLRRPEEQQLKTAIQRVMGIFQSNLFEALLGKFTRGSQRSSFDASFNQTWEHLLDQ